MRVLNWLNLMSRFWRPAVAAFTSCLVGAVLIGCGGGEPKMVSVVISLQLYKEKTDYGRVERLLNQHGIVPVRQDTCGLHSGDEILKTFLFWIDAYSPTLAYFDIQERDLEKARALGFYVVTPGFLEWNPTIFICDGNLEDA